ncbi:hypothetical protein Syun_012155 [Stephania yunnanensis]|uniref:Acyl-coenzyme A thioesterase 13 n=1 Tax=Stephania yunnanensis TaxID=152371 RepID=A0AAP0K172_9MAGN
MGDGEDGAQRAKKIIEDVRDGRVCKEIENMALQGVQVLEAHQGRILCTFVIPNTLVGKDGNWVAGAIATMIDNIGAVAVVSLALRFKASVNFVISYFSTARIDEEVEIEAKVLGHRGKLTAMVVEIRKKSNGKMIALGQQWTSSVSTPESLVSKL